MNLSSRGLGGLGDDALLGGLLIRGGGSERVFLRAIGPSLAVKAVVGRSQNAGCDLGCIGRAFPVIVRSNHVTIRVPKIDIRILQRLGHARTLVILRAPATAATPRSFAAKAQPPGSRSWKLSSRLIRAARRLSAVACQSCVGLSDLRPAKH